MILTSRLVKICQSLCFGCDAKVVNRIEAAWRFAAHVGLSEAVVDTGEIQLQPVFRSEVARKASDPTFEVRAHALGDDLGDL